MMTLKSALSAVVVLVGLAPSAWAQFGMPGMGSPFGGAAGGVPGMGSAIPGAAGGVPGVGAVPAAATGGGGNTLWGFLGISKANCAACKAKFCQSQLGMMVNNGTRSMGMLAGGLLPNCCPPVSAADLAQQADGPAGAQSVAAKIKQDELQAKARVAAVEYLGTVDCHYWPDAEKALIDRLRTDRNECVRFAAARVLGSGCCCTKNTVAALRITLTASEDDGNPSETSERVRAAAFVALQHCEGRVRMPEPTPPERPEEPARPENPDGVRQASFEQSSIKLSSYYSDVLPRKPMSVVVEEARRALTQYANTPRSRGILPTSHRSVADALTDAMHPGAPSAPAHHVAQTAAPARLRPIPRDERRSLAQVDRDLVPASTSPTSDGRPARAPSRGLFGLIRSSLR